MSGTELHRTLHRLSRTHGVRLRPAGEQEVVASMFAVGPEADARFRLRRDRLLGKTETVPIGQVMQRTRREADKLREAGCEVYTQRFGAGPAIEVMKVPVELLESAGADDSKAGSRAQPQ